MAKPHDPAAAEIVDHRDIRVEIAAVRVQRVVDRPQPWRVEGRIRHDADARNRMRAGYLPEFDSSMPRSRSIRCETEV
jgi:hypothetical protein